MKNKYLGKEKLKLLIKSFTQANAHLLKNIVKFIDENSKEWILVWNLKTMKPSCLIRGRIYWNTYEQFNNNKGRFYRDTGCGRKEKAEIFFHIDKKYCIVIRSTNVVPYYYNVWRIIECVSLKECIYN